jgi:hypothetical protein
MTRLTIAVLITVLLVLALADAALAGHVPDHILRPS